MPLLTDEAGWTEPEPSIVPLFHTRYSIRRNVEGS